MSKFLLRFIDSGPRSAVENMAIDEALALSVGQSRDFASLRFYRWQPYALSFGYNFLFCSLIEVYHADLCLSLRFLRI